MSFLWRLWGSRPGEPPQEPTSSDDEDGQSFRQPDAAGPRVILTDEEKWKISMARWRPLIKPTDDMFAETKALFQDNLSQESAMTLNDVLRKYFARSEIRKIGEYADKKSNPILYELQKEAADRYTALLQTTEWKSVADDDSLATKLTMAYFGLPVEPVTMQDLFPGVRSTFFTSVDDPDDDPSNDSMFIPEDKRPLRFLNYYDKRGWGKDDSHLIPNQTFEAYYRLPWISPSKDLSPQTSRSRHQTEVSGPSLRGGGLSSEDEDDLFTDDDVPDDMSVVSDTPMEDAQCATSGINDEDDLFLRGGAGPSSDPEGPSSDLEDTELLYGFSGRQVCRINQPPSFFAAIDRLLALQNRQDIKGNGIPLTIAILTTDGKKENKRFGVCKQLVHGQIGQGPDLEKALYDAVRKVLSEEKGALSGSGARVILFVCFRHQDGPFRNGLGQSVAFQPSLLEDRCVEVSFFTKEEDPDERYPVSYLCIPPNVDKWTPAPYYEEWFRAAYQTSAYEDNNGSLGRTKAQPPSRCILAYDGLQLPSDMPFAREAWIRVTERFWDNIEEKVETERVVVRRQEIEGKSAIYFIPGYAKYRSSPDQEQVFALVWESVWPKNPLKPDDGRVTRIDVKPWDVPWNEKNPEIASFPCRDGKVVQQGPQYQKASAQLKRLLGQNRSLIVQPWFAAHRATFVDDNFKPIMVDVEKEEELRLDLVLDELRNDWPRALKLIRDTFEKTNSWRDNCTIHIDEGNPRVYEMYFNDLELDEENTRMENQVRNRRRWDFEPVDSDEMRNRWQQFAHLVTFFDLEVSVEPKVDEIGEPGTADPLGMKRKYPEKYPWGYNAPRFAGVVQPVGTGLSAAPETQHEQQTRAYGFEAPTFGGKDLPPGSARFQRDQLPNRQPLDLAQRGRIFREWSYGSPLSIKMKNQHPEIPINAPPLEQLLKQRGPDGLASTSLPVVSTQILTPTEQRRLQESFFQMRSVALNRGQLCPHKGCRAYFPVDPSNMAKFHAHLEQKHVGTHCPFCPETLFAHWPHEQRQRHFVDKHSEYFTRKGDLLKEARLADSIESKGLVHLREQQYNFCPRCGRNHNFLNSKGDRTHHDNTCFPGNTIGQAKMTYCTFCGDPELTQGKNPDEPWAWVEHECQVDRGPGAPPAADTFCRNCALPCNKLGMSYARRHLLHCKPADTGRDNWCPWCGIDLMSGPQRQRLQHLENCALKPLTGENPVDTETGQVKESPRDNPEVQRRSFFRPTRREGYDRVVVPDVCPVDDCPKDLTLLNARGLFVHFSDIHPEATNSMTHCPFCLVDFNTRKWTVDKEKEAHFQDHIDRRYERVIADEAISGSEDWNSQKVRDAFLKREMNFLDPAKKITELQEEAVALAEERYRLVKENQSLRQASKQEQKTDGTGSRTKRQQQQEPTEGPFRKPAAKPRTLPPEPDDTPAPQTPAPTPQRTGLFQKSAKGKGKAAVDTAAKDQLYEPERISDDDDDYQEGLVPEPSPDLDISNVLAPITPESMAKGTPLTRTRSQNKGGTAGAGAGPSQPPAAAGSSQGSSQKRGAPTAQSDAPKKQKTASGQAAAVGSPSQDTAAAGPAPSTVASGSPGRKRSSTAPATATISSRGRSGPGGGPPRPASMRQQRTSPPVKIKQEEED